MKNVFLVNRVVITLYAPGDKWDFLPHSAQDNDSKGGKAET